MNHDPLLVTQCREWEARVPHAAICRCDRCSILRGEPTRWPRVYVEGTSEEGHPDSDHPERQTITGRVVRWARATRTLDPWRFYRVEIGRAAGRVSVDVYAPSGRAAESRALAEAT